MVVAAEEDTVKGPVESKTGDGDDHSGSGEAEEAVRVEVDTGEEAVGVEVDPTI